MQYLPYKVNKTERKDGMRKRLKRPLSKKQIIKRALMVSLCILLPVVIYAGYIRVRSFYEVKMEAMTEEMAEYTVTTYEAVRDIKAGEIIKNKMVASKKTLSGQNRKSFMSGDDIGSQALVDIPKGTQLLKNMFQKNIINSSLRELEFSLLIAGENIKAGDYTDIRLRYPDGEDYIVLSRTYISRINWEKGFLYINLSPEEIHLISSAMVDCYLKTGSYLYTARYIAPSYQEASYVTYIPNKDVLKLIKKDPNVVEKAREYLNETGRKELEERLKTFYEQNSSPEDSFSGEASTSEDAGSNPLYYVTGKAGDIKKGRGSKQSMDDISGIPEEAPVNSGKKEGEETLQGVTASDENMEVEYAE